jgi:tetratricopeptide (TPR) repeat protein
MESASFLNSSGIALTEANRPDEAIPFFLEALVIEPVNPLLWFNLGVAQQRTGNYEEAIGSFHRALSIDDNIAEVWVSLGLIAYEMQNTELAENCYLSALERDCADPKTWNNLGVLYFTDGNYEEARLSFEKAVSLMPHYPEALVNLRDVCRELGDFKAAAEFERALSGITGGKDPLSRPGSLV